VDAASAAAALAGPGAAHVDGEVPEAPAAEQPIAVAAAATAHAPVEPVVTATAPAPAVVAPFELPTDELQAVAQAAGLQWVNSDAEKIRAAQEAMANEPKPIHVPREPKPFVAIDEGPLVLVETRKDLSQFKLPFETSQGSQPQA
jgi:ribonuclease E